MESQEIILSFRRLAKRLSSDQKRLRWEVYAKKTERQEEVFKKVCEYVFEKQGKEIADYYSEHGKLPDYLNDEETAKRFGAAIELVYHDAFNDAI